ncbi:MAG: glyoxalase [Halobacteriovoraceae bacterium]|nr:glyoxalase [Halobacteriovoraceae bacterium]|tara:strand:+ start:5037 stop:5417 length:381 start_codon:yes stop_codon:yes gene_type:complete
MSLSAIGIACKDIEKTISFYKLLGLTFEECGEGHYEGSTESGLRIMLDSYELMQKINPSWKVPQSPGITLCFEQATPKQVDEIYNEIINAGFSSEKEPWDAFWGQRYSSVKDPDGNQIDIFASLDA